MVGGSCKLLAYFLSLSLYANHALARVSNITFVDPPTTCGTVTISWRGGVPPFTVTIVQVDAHAQPSTDGILAGNPIQVAETGNARRVVWTVAVEPGEVLVAVVRDGLEQDASSPKRVVQTSNDVTCLAAVSPTDASISSIPLPSLSLLPIENSTSGTPTIVIASATVNPSEMQLTTNQNRVIALPVLLTLFTVGIVVGVLIYGFCIYRTVAPRRRDTQQYDDVERGHYGGDTPNANLRRLGTYGRQLGRDIGRKISALSSQISRRPTAVITTEKPDSFTILPKETSSTAPQEMSQTSPGGIADVVDARPVIGMPIMPVHAMTAPRPTSNLTISTASWVTETGTGLSPRPPASNGKGLRPAPSRSNIRGQGKPLPILPALQLGRQGTKRQYGLPTADNRLEAMRPKSRSKSAIVVEQNHKRVSSIRRSVSAGAVATLDFPPSHLAQVPISALPPATPSTSNIRTYSQVSERPFPEPGATIYGMSSRRRSDTIGSVVMVQEVPFIIESPTVTRPNQPIDTSGTEPRTPLSTTQRNVPRPLIIPSSSPRSDEDSHIDALYDIPQTATTARTRYSMALPESGSLLPPSFSAAQDEVVPPLPSTPFLMAAKMASRPTSPTPSGEPSVRQSVEPKDRVT